MNFTKMSRKIAYYVGSPFAVAFAASLIIGWFAGGFLRADGFSADYQIIVNTGTTIITFLLVFIIQNSQNHDTRAVMLKLDEVLALAKADPIYLNAEDLSEKDLRALEENVAKYGRTQIAIEKTFSNDKVDVQETTKINVQGHHPGELG